MQMGLQGAGGALDLARLGASAGMVRTGGQAMPQGQWRGVGGMQDMISPDWAAQLSSQAMFRMQQQQMQQQMARPQQAVAPSQQPQSQTAAEPAASPRCVSSAAAFGSTACPQGYRLSVVQHDSLAVVAPAGTDAD